MADAAQSTVDRLYLLVAEFAVDLDGRPDGLTCHELRRAWRARHGDAVPRWVLPRLISLGLVYKTRHRRTCVVSGQCRGAYLPSTMRGSA